MSEPGKSPKVRKSGSPEDSLKSEVESPKPVQKESLGEEENNSLPAGQAGIKGRIIVFLAVIGRQFIIEVIFVLIDVKRKLTMQNIGPVFIFFSLCIFYCIAGQINLRLLVVVLLLGIVKVIKINPQLFAFFKVDQVICV